MSDFTFYKLQAWRIVCARDKAETEEMLAHQQESPPHCERRMSDLYSAQDECGMAAERIAAMFKEKV